MAAAYHWPGAWGVVNTADLLQFCHRLWGKPFLWERGLLVDELEGLLEVLKAEETPFDKDRFARMWRDVVLAPIW